MTVNNMWIYKYHILFKNLSTMMKIEDVVYALFVLKLINMCIVFVGVAIAILLFLWAALLLVLFLLIAILRFITESCTPLFMKCQKKLK